MAGPEGCSGGRVDGAARAAESVDLCVAILTRYHDKLRDADEANAVAAMIAAGIEVKPD